MVIEPIICLSQVWFSLSLLSKAYPVFHPPRRLYACSHDGYCPIYPALLACPIVPILSPCGASVNRNLPLFRNCSCVPQPLELPSAGAIPRYPLYRDYRKKVLTAGVKCGTVS